jgi:DNA-binding MarR family transcriptional regulator
MIHDIDALAKRRDALSLLLWVTTLMMEDMQRGLAGYGLTEARAHVLWELGKAERLTQRDLAQALEVTPRNVTALIDALEDTGFVRRTEHPTDRRAIIVVPTKKGQQTIARLQSEMTDFANLLFGKVGERDLRKFSDMLRHIGGRLSDLPKTKPRRGKSA